MQDVLFKFNFTFERHSYTLLLYHEQYYLTAHVQKCDVVNLLCQWRDGYHLSLSKL